MRISRFFVDPKSVDRASGTITLTDAQQLRQIISVLRLVEGDRLDILDGSGAIFQCRLITASKTTSHQSGVIVCAIGSQEVASGEPSFDLVVALPVLRAARFEWAIEKLTELGVRTIVPITVDRSVVVYQSDHSFSANKFTRWQTIVREAAEQCQRALIPDVVKPESFSSFVKRTEFEDAAKFIGAVRLDAPAFDHAIDSTGGAKTICIAIGAEGGFTEEEIGLSFAHGYTPVSLGKRILRAETAALYAASVAVSRLDK